MEQNKKILVLCGGKFAFKALQLLACENYLCGIAIGKGSDTIVDALEQEAENGGIGFKSFPTKNSLTQMRAWIEEIKPDYIFSISFPFLIPNQVLSYGTDKFINFHPGPLPQYRGAMPIFEVIKNQESQTAICAHFMNEKFDEGAIIFNDPVIIQPTYTYGKLTTILSDRLAQVVLNVANMIQYASVIPCVPQDKVLAYYHEKPSLSDTYINWKRMTAPEIIALINACNPWNVGADAILQTEQVKLINAVCIDQIHQQIPGTIVTIDDQHIQIACSDNQIIRVFIIQTDQGIMTAKEYKKTILWAVIAN